jgi:hypothetical protein
MNVTHKVWTYSELADIAESLYRNYDGDDEDKRLELLSAWSHLVAKACHEQAA